MITGIRTITVPVTDLDAAKARRELDWTPRFSLPEGLDRSIAWYRRYLGDDA